MKSEVQIASELVARELNSGKPMLCIIHKYTEAYGEFIHFNQLLLHDLYSSVFIDIDDEIKCLFKEKDLVWLRKECKGIRVIEATYENEAARKEHEIVKEKLKKTPEFSTADKITVVEGHTRFSCSSSKLKKDMN
jgi:hypothetical protein